MFKVVPSISASHSLRSVLNQQPDLHVVSFIMQKKVNIKVVKLTLISDVLCFSIQYKQVEC